jgi:c(7)-type cytochrome triheme protein
MKDREIPLKRVYELPEFVFFSHGKHAGAKVECKSCHGDISQQAVVQLAQPLKMKWCIDCHKQQKASTSCTLCHELGQ